MKENIKEGAPHFFMQNSHGHLGTDRCLPWALQEQLCSHLQNGSFSQKLKSKVWMLLS